MRKLFIACVVLGLLFCLSCDKQTELSLWFVDQAIILKADDIKTLSQAGVNRFVVRSGVLKYDRAGFTLEPTLTVMQIDENSFEWYAAFEFTKGFSRVLNKVNLQELAGFLAESIDEEKNFYGKSKLELSGVVIVCNSPSNVDSSFLELIKILKGKIDNKMEFACAVNAKWANKKSFSKLKSLCDRIYLTSFDEVLILSKEDTRFRLLADDYRGSFALKENRSVLMTPFQGIWNVYDSKGFLRGKLKGLSPDVVFESCPVKIESIRMSDKGEELVTVELLEDVEIVKNKFNAGFFVEMDRLPFHTVKKRIMSAVEGGISIYSLPPEGGVLPVANILKNNISFEPVLTIETVEKGGGRIGFKVKLENKGGGESVISDDFNVKLEVKGGKVIFSDKGSFEQVMLSGNTVELSELYLGPGESCESGIITVETSENSGSEVIYSMNLKEYSGKSHTFSAKYRLGQE